MDKNTNKDILQKASTVTDPDIIGKKKHPSVRDGKNRMRRKYRIIRHIRSAVIHTNCKYLF
jgi:hypothetical protein